MKFMKLGSKPDAFRSDGSCIRFVASELPTDVVIHVEEVRFFLHKFPLLAKSNRLQRLVLRATEDSSDDIVLHDFPGGPKSFEICMKFCYGITVTLNAYNVVSARCAAEYLEMDEGVEKGNLIHKLEVFLNTSVLRSWKDSIIVFQMTTSSLPWSEELKIVGRCIDCIASKTLVDPINVNWSYTYDRKSAASTEIVEKLQGMHKVPSDWWMEDLCELDADLYKRVMVVVKSKGRLSSDMIGEALKAYAARWLPDSYESLIDDDEYMKKSRIIVETIISLLPTDECSGCMCRFLLELLKVAILVGARDVLKDELIDRIGIQLHKASVKSLLIPLKSGSGDTMYDVDLVQSLIHKFTTHIGCSFVDKNGSLVALGKLIDGYLSEIANDPNVSISRFSKLTVSIPDSARPVHDGLYTAIDIYLKEHPNLMKADKRRICNLINVRKLSSEAYVHAAQNERLPLRTVVQVLFFEQLKASRSTLAPTDNASLPQTAMDEEWEGRVVSEHHCSLKQQLGSLKIKVDECRSSDDKRSKSMSEKGGSGGLLLSSSSSSSRSRRLFDKLWAVKGETIRSSETSGSSQSPPVSVKPAEAKSCGSSRHTRYSIS
ncbi:BTB/POZ domain-containing protein NPY1-like isoform X2 [Zingiber officinale]|uniref:BTB/POZ domain-containing protein NPY1-like isoform X2 n=1 Tax=Zingiber officinale TaxID=94328 RepID=UPI001C4BB090|nr:BTB/POZ domain-containing protein NPY1-like isoform X2 [Zingiber officinale]